MMCAGGRAAAESYLLNTNYNNSEMFYKLTMLMIYNEIIKTALRAVFIDGPSTQGVSAGVPRQGAGFLTVLVGGRTR